MEMKKIEKSLALEMQGLDSSAKREKMRQYCERGETGKFFREIFELSDEAMHAIKNVADADSHASDLSEQPRARWRLLVTECRKLAGHPAFTCVIVLAICIVGALEALVTNGHGAPWIRQTNLAILVVFTLEVVVKLIAEGEEPRMYFKVRARPPPSP